MTADHLLGSVHHFLLDILHLHSTLIGTQPVPPEPVHHFLLDILDDLHHEKSLDILETRQHAHNSGL